MVEELFGGLMAVGMKVNLEMVFKVAMEFYTDKAGINSMKVLGITGCLMEKGFNSSKMEKSMKAHLKKINSMAKEYFIRMIR